MMVCCLNVRNHEIINTPAVRKLYSTSSERKNKRNENDPSVLGDGQCAFAESHVGQRSRTPPVAAITGVNKPGAQAVRHIKSPESKRLGRKPFGRNSSDSRSRQSMKVSIPRGSAISRRPEV